MRFSSGELRLRSLRLGFRLGLRLRVPTLLIPLLLRLLLGLGLPLRRGVPAALRGRLGRPPWLATEVNLADHGLELGLVHAEVEPPQEVRVGLPKVLVEDELEPVHQGAGEADVREGDLMSNHVRVRQEVLVEDVQGTLHVLLGLFCGLRDVLEDPLDREGPGAEWDLELVGRELHPTVDHSVFEEVLAIEPDVPAHSCHVPGHSVAGEDAPVLGLKDGDLPDRVPTPFRWRLDIQAIVLRGHEGLPGLVAVRIRVEFHRHLPRTLR